MVFLKYYKFKTSKMVGFKKEDGIINVEKCYKIYINKDKERTDTPHATYPVDVIFAEIYNSSQSNSYYILEETNIKKVMDIINSK